MSVDLSHLQNLDGFVGAALVDSDTGRIIAQTGQTGFDLGAAAMGNAEVIKAKQSAMDRMGMEEVIEDILITLTNQYHLIRTMDFDNSMFIYLVLDRHLTELGMARNRVRKFEKCLELFP